MNIGDKYLNLIFLYGIWQDIGILLMGNFVWNLSLCFLSIWYVLLETEEDY